MKTKPALPPKQKALAKALRAPKPMPPIPAMNPVDQVSNDGGN
jgi:hypothetical protein